MTGSSRHLRAGAIALAILAGAAGCAKDPTGVYTIVDVDANVPPVLRLRMTVARASDPTQKSVSERSSPNTGDAADRPGPWIFPVGFSLTVDASLVGPVKITVESLDWDSGAVRASGSTDAVIEAQKEIVAALKLMAVGAGPVDGGAPDGGTDDAAFSSSSSSSSSD